MNDRNPHACAHMRVLHLPCEGLSKTCKNSFFIHTHPHYQVALCQNCIKPWPIWSFCPIWDRTLFDIFLEVLFVCKVGWISWCSAPRMASRGIWPALCRSRQPINKWKINESFSHDHFEVGMWFDRVAVKHGTFLGLSVCPSGLWLRGQQSWD